MDGKVVIITGGARGQGLAEASFLAGRGASVVVTDLLSEGEDAVKQIDGDAIFFRQDVGCPDDWDRLIDLIKTRYGRLDGLVNNAAIMEPASMEATGMELWDRHYRANQLSVFLGMRAATPLMKENGGGSIVNVSSLAGHVGTPGIFAYATTKWAVRGMTQQAARELGEYAIRVNSVAPGAIDTPMIAGAERLRSDAFVDAIPLRRIGMPQDLAGVIAFLVSDRSSYISGAEITVTGGL